jgi:hypothetical protein
VNFFPPTCKAGVGMADPALGHGFPAPHGEQLV